ncbi:hypothetical protein IAT38_005032 [Cryptococcus sp. DSM 104549]
MSVQPSQADIFAALTAQAASRSAPPPTSPYSTFAPDPYALLTSSPASVPSSDVPSAESQQGRTNTRKVYCPREECGSVIMQPGVGAWVEVDGPVLPQDPSSPFPAPHLLPSSRYPLWYIPTGPFAFDNIGFSRPDASTALPAHAPTPTSGAGGKVKWLICAECDLGPVGWSYEGAQDCWVAVERVRYGEGNKLI